MFGWEVIPRIGIGGFTVSPHGVAIALGYFVGTWLTARKVKSRGMDDDAVWNAAAVSVLGAIVGARVAYVVGHFSEFESPAEWLKIWQGGLSLVGALIGAFSAGYLYTRRKQIDFFGIADTGMPFLALGIAIGRTGDLMIGDHLGKQTSGWWGWKYKGGELISPPPCTYKTVDGCIEAGMVVHQTALYDAVWSLVIFGILMTLARQPRNRGFFVLTWASLYSVGRIATDFTRVDKRWLSGLLEPWLGQGLTGSQLTAVAVLAACLLLLAKFRGAPPRKAGLSDGAGRKPAEGGQPAQKPAVGGQLAQEPAEGGQLAQEPADGGQLAEQAAQDRPSRAEPRSGGQVEPVSGGTPETGSAGTEDQARASQTKRDSPAPEPPPKPAPADVRPLPDSSETPEEAAAAGAADTTTPPETGGP